MLAGDKLPNIATGAPADLLYGLEGTQEGGLSYNGGGIAATPLPNDCSDLTITATAMNAFGTSTASLLLNMVIETGYDAIVEGTPICSLTAVGGPAVSCTVDMGGVVAANKALALGLGIIADSGFSGAAIYTKATCTP